MKFLGVDFAIKYISTEIDGKDVMISFRDTRWKGVHDVHVYFSPKDWSTMPKIKIKNTYPGFIGRTKETVFLIKMGLKHAINRVSKSNG